MKLLTLVLALLLSACATCGRHPVVCGAVGSVVAASVALSLNEGGGSNASSHITPHMSPCRPEGVTPC